MTVLTKRANLTKQIPMGRASFREFPQPFDPILDGCDISLRSIKTVRFNTVTDRLEQVIFGLLEYDEIKQPA
ncbi:MAG: hypothetical protein ABL912_04005 [Novosphingobium sp.]